MTQPGETDSLVGAEDFRQASFKVGPSDGPAEFGVDVAGAVDFLRETEHLWDKRDAAEVALWALTIGVVAEKHRVHREYHE